MSTENTAPETTEATERKRAPAANFLPIVRGRLPLLLVHAVRFDPVISAMGNKDIAAKFGTSVGKVFDIKKGRNFSYITEDYKPTAEDAAAAMEWAAQFGAENAKGLTAGGDRSLIEKLVDQYKAAGLGTAEDVAKVSEARAATRKPRAPKAEAAATPASAEELLS
jgi:hypothetical protein